MSSSYQTYSTETKLIFALGQEKLFYNRQQLQTIPSSNKSRWRGDHPKRYFEYEVSQKFRECFRKGVEVHQTPGLNTIVSCYLSIFLFLHSFLCTFDINLKKVLFEHRSKVVNFIQQKTQLLPLNDVLSAFGISSSTYYYWLKEEVFACHTSLFSKCFKRHPLQLSNSETRKIRELLTDLKYQHWSLESLQRYASKHNLVHACVSSFYKVKRLFQINRARAKKPKQSEGVRASKPNEIWHADITEIKTPNGKRFYLYMIMDNFSRKILNWELHRKKSGALWAELLKNTFHSFRSAISTEVHFWTDDGSENCNTEMVQCISRLDFKHVIAQKDVHFSNSMIEAVFRSFKKYFMKYVFPNSEKLMRQKVAEFVLDHNSVKPHVALSDRQTPDEAFYKIPVDQISISKNKAKARAQRIEENRKAQCQNC